MVSHISREADSVHGVYSSKTKFKSVQMLYIKQAEKRRKAMAALKENDPKALALLYMVVVPEVRFKKLHSQVFCPSLVRVGQVGDGGKWVCNPFALSSAPPSSAKQDSCAVYSIGLREVSHSVQG